MRQARIKIMEETAVHHCICRIVGGQFLLDDPAKETFRLFMWQQADFAGLQILTYCLMSNHTHILVRVPRPGEISDAQLADRVQALYGADAPETLRLREGLARGIAIPHQQRRRVLRRMGNSGSGNLTVARLDMRADPDFTATAPPDGSWIIELRSGSRSRAHKADWSGPPGHVRWPEPIRDSTARPPALPR